MTTAKVAIIQFPGTNCEYDAQRAAVASGMDAHIIRWTADPDSLHDYDGYMLPGGFSYQDRVRAGAISAKLPILSFLREADQEGKPILGICNGCQILAETGVLPNIGGDQHVEMALGHNYRNGKAIGFNHDWVYVRVQRGGNSVFTQSSYAQDMAIPIPVSHGEGRFVFSEDAKAILNDCTVITYCDNEGNDADAPNGAEFNIAGLCNKKGNVMAIMPHPERAYFTRQLPSYMDNTWSTEKRLDLDASRDQCSPWSYLFHNMLTYVESRQ